MLCRRNGISMRARRRRTSRRTGLLGQPNGHLNNKSSNWRFPVASGCGPGRDSTGAQHDEAVENQLGGPAHVRGAGIAFVAKAPLESVLMPGNLGDDQVIEKRQDADDSLSASRAPAGERGGPDRPRSAPVVGGLLDLRLDRLRDRGASGSCGTCDGVLSGGAADFIRCGIPSRRGWWRQTSTSRR